MESYLNTYADIDVAKQSFGVNLFDSKTADHYAYPDEQIRRCTQKLTDTNV